MTELANNNNDELILEFFNEEYKAINSLEDFTTVVRKIEKIKNYSSEIFIKLLIYHRIVKGNKQLYYIGMMVLREEDPEMYIKILGLNVLKFYSKDLLRLCRIYNFIGQRNSDSKINIDIKDTTGHKNIKLIMWNKKNCMDDLKIKEIYLSVEAKLYGDTLYRTIKEILNGNYGSNDINLVLFKYISYESGHFNLESMFIWKYVEDLLQKDNDIPNILKDNLGLISDAESEED
jgi:hypothetical protein